MFCCFIIKALLLKDVYQTDYETNRNSFPNVNNGLYKNIYLQKDGGIVL